MSDNAALPPGNLSVISPPPRPPVDLLNVQPSTRFWFTHLDLGGNFIEFIRHTVGGPGELNAQVDIMSITDITEDEMARRIQHVLDTRGHELPPSSFDIILSNSPQFLFEVLITVDDEGRSQVTWTQGARSQAAVYDELSAAENIPRGLPAPGSVPDRAVILAFWRNALHGFELSAVDDQSQDPTIRLTNPAQYGEALLRVHDVIERVQRGTLLPPGGHIYPISIICADGNPLFVPAEWDAFDIDAAKNRSRVDTAAPPPPPPNPPRADGPGNSSGDDGQGSSETGSSSSSGSEDGWEDPSNSIPDPGQDDRNGFYQSRPAVHGGRPPGMHVHSPWPAGAPNNLAGPSLAPWPAAGHGLPPAVGIPNSFWNPVIPVRAPHRMVHIPVLPAHQWGTLYRSHRPIFLHAPRKISCAPCAPLQMYPCHFPMPMPPRHNPLHPDLSAPMKWPVYLPPGSAQVLRHGMRSSPPLLQAYATSPPCFSVAITFENPSLMHWMQRWGAIRVPVHFRAVTVGDVLAAIYNYVSEPLTASDLAAIVPRDRHKMEEGARVRQMRGHPHSRVVPVRSDVFQNLVLFGGLRLLSVSGKDVYLALQLVPGY
ncbi:hypothetical protein B0H11DRAFT_2031494 [Mycena galericulata]|nr:hypothetical protein B0H11DRAFT_2031494 [Mycena galericulata]